VNLLFLIGYLGIDNVDCDIDIAPCGFGIRARLMSRIRQRLRDIVR
jgi:hypothetical protein